MSAATLGACFGMRTQPNPKKIFPKISKTEQNTLLYRDKDELDLGRAVALRFVDRFLPAEYQTVVDFFRHRGAYQKFKALLQRNGVLEAWYQYETSEVENAIREWAAENSIPVAPSSGENLP